MLKLTNKKIIAIGIVPRIDDVYTDRIEEFLNGTHPMSPMRTQYDSGIKRKTVLDQSPMGPREIREESGDKASHDNVGSGYNADRADDEIKPGFATNSDPEQRFTDPNISELAFKNDQDTSSNWSPLNYNSRQHDTVVRNLGEIYSRPLPIRVPFNRRNWKRSY